MTSEKKFNLDRFIAMIAFLISIATLFTFVYQTQLMRKQQFASVMPYLLAGHHGKGTKDYSYVLSNAGLGPAFIEDIHVVYKNKTYPGDLSEFMVAYEEEFRDTFQYGYSSVFVGMLVPANDDVQLLESTGDYKNSIKLAELMDEANLILTYKSIYEESWELSADDYVPQKIK